MAVIYADCDGGRLRRQLEYRKAKEDNVNYNRYELQVDKYLTELTENIKNGSTKDYIQISDTFIQTANFSLLKLIVNSKGFEFNRNPYCGRNSEMVTISLPK